MQVTGCAWACLSVRDLDRSLAWYRQVLGLDVLTTNADTCAIDTADRFTYLVDPTSLCVVGLEQRADNDATAFRPESAGLDHLTFAVGPDGLAASQQHLDGCGLAYAGPTRWQAGSFLELIDPDGIPVRIFERS